MAPKTEKASYHVDAFLKMDAILNYIEKANGPVSFAEIYADLLLPKSSTYRMVTSLTELGYLSKTMDGRFVLGMRLFQLGNSAASNINIRNASRQILTELTEQTGLTTHLAILNDKDQAVYVDKAEAQDITIKDTKIGDKVYLHCSGAGKALLAWQPQDTLDRILAGIDYKPYTEHTITNRDLFQKDLELTKARGYALDDQERRMNIRGLGVSVLDWNGNVAGAISIGGIAAELIPERYDELVARLQQASKNISQKLTG